MLSPREIQIQRDNDRTASWFCSPLLVPFINISLHKSKRKEWLFLILSLVCWHLRLFRSWCGKCVRVPILQENVSPSHSSRGTRAGPRVTISHMSVSWCCSDVTDGLYLFLLLCERACYAWMNGAETRVGNMWHTGEAWFIQRLCCVHGQSMKTTDSLVFRVTVVWFDEPIHHLGCFWHSDFIVSTFC